MVAFEIFQTVPLVALCDMNPYMQVTPQRQAFPLPGEEFSFVRLDLSRALIRSPEQTFFIQVTEEGMIDEGIERGDILIVDREAKVRDHSLVVVFLEGEFLVRRIVFEGEIATIHAAHPERQPIVIEPDMDFGVWGLVRDVLRDNLVNS